MIINETTRGANTLAVGAILILSASLNLWNIGFPLGYHIDEPVKVGFIEHGTQDFNHPILMLQLVRIANRTFRLSTDQQIAVLGRSIIALCGTVSVLLSYLLARRASGSTPLAMMTALGVAVSPTLVLHAHYLKEDTLLTACLLASLLAVLRFVKSPDRRSAVWLGLAAGLAFSSHYKSILLVPLVVAAPLVGGPTPAVEDGPAWRRAFYRQLPFAGIVAASVFLIVNWPLAHDPRGFLAGVDFEAQHALVGQDARVRPGDYWFGFHLLNSLAPGMGWPALACGLAGLLWILARWRAAGGQDRLLAIYVLLFYFVPEISPLKPAPDFARYMVVIVPALMCLGWRAVEWAANRLGSRVTASLLFSVVTIAAVVHPLADTVRLISSIEPDTRARAAEWLQQHGGKALVEQYAGLPANMWTAAEVDVVRARQEGVEYLVTSSFMYGRFFLGSELRNQDEEIYRIHQRYVDLFKHPYVEIAPAYRSSGFSNPVIRIVDIRGSKGLGALDAK